MTQANLLAHGAAYLAMGFVGFLNPAGKLAQLELVIPVAALTTFRVIYGGLMIGIASILIMATFVKGM